MINTVIITDPMGAETSEEVIEQVSSNTGISYDKFKVIRHDEGVTKEIEKIANKIDFLIIDYGGMSWGSEGLAKSQIKWVCEWAKDHPGKIAVLFTMYTAEIYFGELDEQFGECDNIIARYSDKYSGDVKKISAWLKALDR